MELNEFKELWNRTGNMPAEDVVVVDLLRHDSMGLIASLKRRFRKSLALVLILLMYVSGIFLRKAGLLHNVLFWYLICFYLLVIVYFVYSYVIIRRLERMDNAVKAVLEKQVDLLTRAVFLRLLITRLIAVIFFILVEYLVAADHQQVLKSWTAVPVYQRLGYYMLFLTGFYVITGRALKRRYSDELIKLKTLIHEINQ